LVRREQDTAKQLSALNAALVNLLSVPTGQQSAASIADLRSSIGMLTRARQTLGQQIAKEFPTYAQLVNPAPGRVEETRASMRPGEAWMAMLVGEKKTYVWSVPKDGPLAFATAPIGAKGLGALVTRVRAALTTGARTVGEIPPFDLEAAYELYR